MKQRYIILTIVCLLIGNTAAFAQTFSISSSDFHSYGEGGCGLSYSVGVAMRSTSSYTTGTTMSSYSTAPMHVANGSIRTVAYQLDDIRLADDLIDGSEGQNSGYIPTGPQRSIAPPQFAPLGLEWDALLFLLVLISIYIVHRHVHFYRLRSLFSKLK